MAMLGSDAAFDHASAAHRNRAFLADDLYCYPGKLEIARNRFEIITYADATFTDLFARFCNDVRTHKKSSLLVEFPNLAGPSVKTQAQEMAELIAPHFNTSALYLLDEGILQFDLALICPVTGVEARYDFFGVAFTNAARRSDDPLYDPPQFLPVPAIMFSADALSFAHLTRELALHKHNAAPNELSQDERAKLFDTVVRQWDRLAINTLNSFASMTDTIRIEPDGKHWIANHQDPVFSEQRKCPYRHEMPRLYCARIVAQWAAAISGEQTTIKPRGGQSAIGRV